ncbi:MAG TPA: hypothetical protein VLT58_17935 [Polyangia bacterium]|nr:hypothetical protein [Polyangia bacterium]
MSWNGASVLALVAAVLAVVGARPAQAGATPGCAAVAVAVDPSVRGRWPEVAATIREAFQMRADVDTCARIEVTAMGTAIDLIVVLPDGRVASRSVSRAEDILPALEGLLLLPDPAGEDHTTDTRAPPPNRRESEAPPASPPAVVRLAAPPAPVDRGTPFRLELDLAADARTGDGWVGGGGGVGAFADIAHWLVGFQGRIDGYRTAADTGGHGMALELIALGGHRFALGPTRTLDLTVGPALALHAAAAVTARVSAQMTSVPMPQPDGNQRLARLILGCRLTFGAQSLLRTFVQVDADIGERDPTSGSTPDGAGLPAWTVGLALGAAVGTR